MPTKQKRPMPKKNSGKRAKRPDECWYKNLDLPAETALYYGFTPIDAPTVSKIDTKAARGITEPELRNKEAEDASARFSLEDKVRLIRLYNEQKMEALPQPVMLYMGSPLPREGSEKKSTNKERSVALEVLGTPKSIAEALLIKTSIEILKEEGFEKLCVHINSIGDRDTFSRFNRELSAYYRKNIDELETHCRQMLKRNVLGVLSCKNEKCQILAGNAPKSMGFLSEVSRQHFKEVLEYIEILEIPYEIDHCLIAERGFCCQTLFEIHNPESLATGTPLAVGIRYANIAKKLGNKRDLPGIGVRLTFTEKKSPKNLKFLKPKIYFVQLGFEAKLKSLKIIEILRQAKIPTYQAISRDKLVSQLSVAENMKIPYTIIMGQKEALDNTVIVRDMSNRSQESIKIADLPKYLKKL